jgi:surface carbohydrate biosynthesis protein
LGKWCAKNNMRLKICAMSSEHTSQEKEFYADLLRGSEWEYMPRSDQYTSYKLVDAAKIVVFIDSTLGYESIGRGKKTASFSCRGVNLGREGTQFGWPGNFQNNGPFWTNEQDEQQFQRVMDYLNTVSDEEWEQAREPYASELMEFDPGNTRFAALLQQLLTKSEKRIHVN